MNNDYNLGDKSKTNACNNSTTNEFTFSDVDLNFEKLRLMMVTFVGERDWMKFHTPRNVALALFGEVGELAEIFQWKGRVERGIPDWTVRERTHLGEELSDVMIYLIRLADLCAIDLTYFLADRQPEFSSKPYAGFSRNLSLEDVRKLCNDVADFPRNLVFSVVVAAGEISKLFQSKGECELHLPDWSEKENYELSLAMVKLAHVLLQLSSVCCVDLSVAIIEKYKSNVKKYPAEKVKGMCKKYTEYVVNEI